jgi:UDP:flavonoid glycosyltransferase YjiC (YdhE family)
MIWILITHPKLKELMNFRLSQKLPKLPPPFDIWQPENHYLVPSIPETDFPCYVAANVTPCGPILLPEPPVEESDPKLLAWLEQGPTVLINLGSHVRMDDAMAREFARALKVLLDSRPDVQVLWKLKKSGGLGLRGNGKSESHGGDVTANSLEVIGKDIASGRIRVEGWLSVDPVAVLQSGHVVCSVHHGGSNSFHEALR